MSHSAIWLFNIDGSRDTLENFRLKLLDECKYKKITSV